LAQLIKKAGKKDGGKVKQKEIPDIVSCRSAVRQLGFRTSFDLTYKIRKGRREIQRAESFGWGKATISVLTEPKGKLISAKCWLAF